LSDKELNEIRLGLKENAAQFSLLVLVNAFVGGMVGIERTVLPLIAESDFHLSSNSVVLSFLISFGLTKAVLNLASGFLSQHLGRRNLLILGWLFALPVPFLILRAPNWNWIVFANVLLGINQGLCWSTTVIMKIDLVGPTKRGLAMGLNEFAGYVAVAISAFLSGYFATRYGLRTTPFYLGILFAISGLLCSIFFIRDTKAHVDIEAKQHSGASNLTWKEIFLRTTWKDKKLFAISQAGMVNNLNDGMIWGLLPIYLSSFNKSPDQIGIMASIYPAVWGFMQLLTGGLSDRYGRNWIITSGMWVQGLAILLLGTFSTNSIWITALVFLGIGTAQVYPTLLAAVSDRSHPSWRAASVGVYRFWRDFGYALGALISGVVADFFGLNTSIILIGCITLISGVLTALILHDRGSQLRNEKFATAI
jgi:MFS family permease